VTAVFEDSQSQDNNFFANDAAMSPDGLADEQTSAVDLLELDIDLRLTDLWRCVDEHQGPWTLDLVACFVRAAYGQGYCDALEEQERGRLCAEHGFNVPQPSSAGLLPSPPLSSTAN
jgi:hypothetical protein